MANATINCTAWMAGSADRAPNDAHAWGAIGTLAFSVVSLLFAMAMQRLEINEEYVGYAFGTPLFLGILSWLGGFLAFVFYFADNVGGHRHYERVCMAHLPSLLVVILCPILTVTGIFQLLYMFTWGAEDKNLCKGICGCFGECYNKVQCDECWGCCDYPTQGESSTQPQASDRKPLLEETSDIEGGGSRVYMKLADGTEITPAKWNDVNTRLRRLESAIPQAPPAVPTLVPNNDLSLRGIPEWQRDL
jgi:hypothetical protein